MSSSRFYFPEAELILSRLKTIENSNIAYCDKSSAMRKLYKWIRFTNKSHTATEVVQMILIH